MREFEGGVIVLGEKSFKWRKSWNFLRLRLMFHSFKYVYDSLAHWIGLALLLHAINQTLFYSMKTAGLHHHDKYDGANGESSKWRIQISHAILQVQDPVSHIVLS
jgi:hypothetical protein